MSCVRSLVRLFTSKPLPSGLTMSECKLMEEYLNEKHDMSEYDGVWRASRVCDHDVWRLKEFSRDTPIISLRYNRNNEGYNEVSLQKMRNLYKHFTCNFPIYYNHEDQNRFYITDRAMLHKLKFEALEYHKLKTNRRSM